MKKKDINYTEKIENHEEEQSNELINLFNFLQKKLKIEKNQNYEVFTNSLGEEIKLTKINEKYISHGGYGNITEDLYFVNDTATNQTTMVTKEMHHSRFFMRMAKSLILPNNLKVYSYLDSVNIPTFKTLLINKDKTKVLTPNLNQDGVWAISANNPFPQGYDIDTSKITQTHVNTLFKEIEKTISIAKKGNIILHQDSIFLLFHPNGEITHIIGDLDLIKLPNNNSLHKLDSQIINSQLLDSAKTILNKVIN